MWRVLRPAAQRPGPVHCMSCGLRERESSVQEEKTSAGLGYRYQALPLLLAVRRQQVTLVRPPNKSTAVSIRMVKRQLLNRDNRARATPLFGYCNTATWCRRQSAGCRHRSVEGVRRSGVDRFLPNSFVCFYPRGFFCSFHLPDDGIAGLRPKKKTQKTNKK